MTSVELFRAEQQLMTYHTWEEALRSALLAYARAPFLIGDLLLYGEEHFPVEFSQALPDPTSVKWKPDTLRKFMWVCSRVPAHLRREGLSFTHHQVVAGLDTAMQQQLLIRAEEESWTTKELGDHINAIEAPQKAPEAPVEADEGDGIDTASEAPEDAREAVVSYCRSKEQSRWDAHDTAMIAHLFG